MPRALLECCKCGDVITLASGMLLVDGAEQAVPIRGCCYGCSGVSNNAEFKRLASRSWRKRSGAPRRARDLDFNKKIADLKLEHPGASRNSLRKLTHNWGLRGAGVADNALNITDIAKGVSVSIMCRHTNCFFYGMIDQWIKHVYFEEFRCPQCGQVYRPWTSGKHLLPVQKVVSMIDPANGKAVCFPAKWANPRTDPSKFADKVELVASSIKIGEDLEGFMHASIARLRNLLEKVATPVKFTQLEWNSKMECMLHSTTFPKSQWARLKDNGVSGMKMQWDAAHKDGFDNWDELSRLLASISAAAQATGSTL